MKTLVDPDAQMYRYRCDGPLCNPKYSALCNPKSSDRLFETDINCIINMIYCHRDINIETHGWSHIISKNGVLHICSDCTTATINTIRKKIELYISNLPVKKASLQIANLLFDLDLYDD